VPPHLRSADTGHASSTPVAPDLGVHSPPIVPEVQVAPEANTAPSESAAVAIRALSNPNVFGVATHIELLPDTPSSGGHSVTPLAASIPDSQTPPAPISVSCVKNVARQLRFTSVDTSLAGLKIHSQPNLSTKRTCPSSPTSSLPLDNQLEPLFEHMMQH
jgi:hypothetical protein